MHQPVWHVLTPQLAAGKAGEGLLRIAAQRLADIDLRADDSLEQIRRVRYQALERALECGNDAQALRVCVSVLCDLRAQGWEIRVHNDAIEIRAPEEAADFMQEKARIRAGLLVERDQQLNLPSVRRFIQAMERRRLGPTGQWVSVFSLMRDGRDLADQLRRVREIPSEAAKSEALRRIIRPYIQVVDDSTCPYTGIKLKDIWRYFRHTWVSPHNNLPGRNVWFLIRDAAVDHHPVIGIAALGSAVVQLRIRDEWIGWARERFIERLRENPTDEWACWIDQRLEEQLADIYADDLFERGLLTDDWVARPSPECIRALRELAKEARETHRLYGSAREHKGISEDATPINWEERARTHLFLSKRAATLADILEDRWVLQNNGFTEPAGEFLAKTLRRAPARKAIGRILRRTKAAHVGIDMLDITVCGSVPPYNHILGGKLVSLLLTSPEVRAAYEQRYGDRPSVIASSMAGRAVHRPPRLVLLGTTSLYGVGSSQYNRLRMPAENVGGIPGAEIRYVELGVTEGYGSFHFSSETLNEIRILYAQTGNGRRVKHIFGEGANPRMREVREALDRVGLPSDRLLRHGSSRVVYAIPLATNFRDVLIAQSSSPEYIIPGDQPTDRTQAIVDYWIERWLSKRIQNDHLLDAVATHTLSYPIDHGARVMLPPNGDQSSLFASVDNE